MVVAVRSGWVASIVLCGEAAAGGLVAVDSGSKTTVVGGVEIQLGCSAAACWMLLMVEVRQRRGRRRAWRISKMRLGVGRDL